MAEDFNEAPVAFEDKDKQLRLIEHIKIDDIECQTCNAKLRLIGKIKGHMKDSKHFSIQIKRKDHPNFEEVNCYLCSESNIKQLYIILNQGNVDKLKNIIYCLKDLPQGFNAQPLMDFIEEEDIIHRKLNKVQLKYKYKETYYNVLKPLSIADMIYQRKLYESKEDYEIDLLENKERYCFLLPENFNQINITPGKVLKFTKKDKKENFEFLAVITYNEILEKKENDAEQINQLKIRINPINIHITSLKGHAGLYKIKEGFCLIPYTRMMEALDIFEKDIPDDEDEIYERAVSLYLTERILGNLPFDLKSHDEELINKVNEILRIEKNTVELILFKENKPKLVKEINDFGSLNESQTIALENIFKNPLNLIQGPPGTGKTFLSSFIVYNIFNEKKDDEDKILLCAPSNSAADNLASYMIRINRVTGQKMKILRIYSKTREYLKINKDLEEISLHQLIRQKFGDDLQDFDKSEIDEETDKIIDNYDIIITTCSTSWDERINSKNFAFVLIDEATQCCELEAMIPVVHGCKHLTLIGDQKQLGPVIIHPQAKKFGMNISLFERMIKLYPQLYTMLTIQYRMHPEIIKFPSEQFYENKIENVENLINERKLSANFNKEFGWPKNDIPLLFIHCEGEEKVILSSKSKYNEDEANIVVLFLEKLIKCGIDMKDIGVITPYVAQIDKIKSLLIEKNIPNYLNLKIASVDSFQGGEKKFIILSNVRSNKENNIGFLQDYRRLNVSITRAIYGMVIIGNAKCLYKEQTVWRNFINYYQRNHLIYTPKIKEGNDGEKEFDINDLKEVTIGNEEDINLVEESFVYGKEEDYKEINEDLIDNFECSNNNYGQWNKKYLNEKNNKKKNYK